MMARMLSNKMLPKNGSTLCRFPVNSKTNMN